MKIKDASALVQLLLLTSALAGRALANDQHPQADEPIQHQINKYFVSVASNITISVDILPEVRELSIVPNGATIDPIGHTAVVFDISGVDINNSTVLPITFVVPVTTYLDLPVTGSTAQTLMIPVSTSIAVQGMTTSITRVLYGFSRQTFPQLSRVVISRFSPDWPCYVTEMSSFEVPPLI